VVHLTGVRPYTLLPFPLHHACLLDPLSIRPRPLSNTWWSFLSPSIPLVPPLPSDVSSAGKSASTDAELFPSDEQLSQRTLWTALLVVLGWSVLGLAGALPLYLINTECLATSAPRAVYEGVYSSLQDLSLMRLLQALDNERVQFQSTSLFSNPNSTLIRRADEPTSPDWRLPAPRIRLIILAALVCILAVLPALYKLLREYARLAAHRRRWIDVRCDGLEMGWLSARAAPGFVGWGEKRVKEFIVKSGMSSKMDTGTPATREEERRSRRRAPDLVRAEENKLDVDVHSLFSIG
jgi:calcium permeable stress-gated cation channel